MRSNVAETLFAASMVTWQVVPTAAAHAPLQPVKLEPAPAVAVRVTVVPSSKSACAPLAALVSMPTGSLVTVPVPVPPTETSSANVARGAGGVEQAARTSSSVLASAAQTGRREWGGRFMWGSSVSLALGTSEG